MKCDSCGVDIPPAWSRVIAVNICPNCEGSIMSDGTIELMTGLKEALEKMPNDPQGIAGWLLSNYRMQKVGDGAPTEFIGVKPKGQNNQLVTADGIKIAPSPLERFQKLAGVKVEAPEKYKALISEINGGVLDDEQDEHQPERQGSNEDYLPEADDPEYTKKALRAMNGASFKKSQLNIGNSDVNDEADLSGLHPSLHNDRLVRLAKQRDLDMGGVGKIKRG